MIELAQHIEALLLENDCVIIPEFGGFVAHNTPASKVEEDNLFLPPVRTIGFNPQLKINDGVLAQSYMAVHDTDFPDATRMVEEEVTELIAVLHNEGKVDLANIGELRYTIYDNYEFVPYDNKITTPYLYGLDSFEMKELTALHHAEEKVLIPLLHEQKRTYDIRINRTFLRSAVAAVAAIALFFFLSTPVENTYIEKGNYAQMLPIDLFEKIEEQSLVTTPISIQKEKKQNIKKTSVASPKKNVEKSSIKPVAVKEVKVTSNPDAKVEKKQKNPLVQQAPVKIQPKQPEGNYHIIVAGGIGMKDAEKIAQELRSKGFANAKALNCEGKVRVSILSCATHEEATKQLLKVRENEAYKNAWLLAK